MQTLITLESTVLQIAVCTRLAFLYAKDSSNNAIKFTCYSSISTQHLYYHLHETCRLQTERGPPSNAECPAHTHSTGTLEAVDPGD